MSTEMWIIAAVRLLGALPVLRWPFYGALIAIAVDQSDLFMMNLIDLGGVSDYQTFDKYLDQAYLLAFLAVALRWDGYARNVAVGLYVYRLVGFVAFEVMQERDVLLLFPNLFEFWFVLIAGLMHFGWLPQTSSHDTVSVAHGRAPLRSDGKDDPSIANRGSGRPRESPLQYRDGTNHYLSARTLILICLPLVALKMFQEYAIHYARWLDSFTAVEAVEAVWRWFSQPFS